MYICFPSMDINRNLQSSVQIGAQRDCGYRSGGARRGNQCCYGISSDILHSRKDEQCLAILDL